MTETPLWSITNSGNLDAHIGSYIFYEDLYRSNHITTYVVPFVIGMLLARDSIVGILIPSSISLPASLFTRSVLHHPATNSLVTLLARLYCDDHYREGPEIPLRYMEWQILIFIYANSTKPSKTPVEHLYNHPVTLWCLIAHKVLSITSFSNDVIPFIKWQHMSMVRKLNHLWLTS